MRGHQGVSRGTINPQRIISVVTGSRAEYGIVKTLLKKITMHDQLCLQLIVTGMHLLRKHGNTWNDVQKDGFSIASKIFMYGKKTEDPAHYAQSFARAVHKMARFWANQTPDIVVVTGDRLEQLAATLAVSTLNASFRNAGGFSQRRIALVHIHGGERTDSGDIDESIRHSITRFAHVHFTATQVAEKRLLLMGEEAFRVHWVGAPGLDALSTELGMSKSRVYRYFGCDEKKPLIVCLFHSIHLRSEKAGREMSIVTQALQLLKIQTVFIYPNNDAGSQTIIQQIQKNKNEPWVRRVASSLNHDVYSQLLRHASVLVGNSSSGIIEAPLYHLPVVNIGERQSEREQSTNVVNVDVRKGDIVRGIKKCLNDKRFLNHLREAKSPYGNGHASERIVKILSQISLNDRLFHKSITY